ncbi:phage antirepressor KilAC domain-containing protein [Bacteroides fragilis]|jgi:anti-repressor protein|nr:phage antirepressor KilAC domain-containing protein [Bacteroides fragilis]
MKELILSKETMSSVEIAELTGKEHYNVIRDIRTLLEQGVAALNFEASTYKDANQRDRPCFNLTKKGCLILASGYDAKLREKIIDRWEVLEIEKQKAILSIPNFNNPAEAARAWADQYENNQVLARNNAQKDMLLTEQAPKVLFADAVVASENSILIGRLANVLKQNGIEIGQNRLFKWLRDNGYLCKCGEKYNQPTQMAMELELFEVSYGSIVRADKSINTITTKVTGKGQIYFINKFLKK